MTNNLPNKLMHRNPGRTRILLNGRRLPGSGDLGRWAEGKRHPDMATIQLAWRDLLIENVPDAEFLRCYDMWTGLPRCSIRFIAANRWGDLFIDVKDQGIHRLDVLFGLWGKCSSSFEEFKQQINDREWQSENLLSSRVFEAKNLGISLGDRQVYGMVPHPRLNGNSLSFDRLMPLDLPVAHAMYSDFVAQTGGVEVE